MAEGTSLEEAVRSAVREGRAELAYLDEFADDLIQDFGVDPQAETVESGPINRLDGFSRWFPGYLRRHLDRERDSLGSFNIVFFGRTGVGKSTLLSSFGRLDGSYV